MKSLLRQVIMTAVAALVLLSMLVGCATVPAPASCKLEMPNKIEELPAASETLLNIGMDCVSIPLPPNTPDFIDLLPQVSDQIIAAAPIGLLKALGYGRLLSVHGVPVGRETYTLIIRLDTEGLSTCPGYILVTRVQVIALIHMVTMQYAGDSLKISRAYLYSDLNLVEVHLETVNRVIHQEVERLRGALL